MGKNRSALVWLLKKKKDRVGQRSDKEDEGKTDHDATSTMLHGVEGQSV